jgi:hypothetical protein
MISPVNQVYPTALYHAPGDHGLSATGMEPRFGLGVLPSDFSYGGVLPRSGYFQHLPTGYTRPYSLARRLSHDLERDLKGMHIGKDGFQAIVDVHQFQPSEITVKTVGHYVVVEGKHEERDDGHGSVQRHFVRKYQLPKDYDLNSMHSSLSSDGILIIKASPPAALSGGEKQIQITHTNAPAHVLVKHHHNEKQEEKRDDKKNGK